jgi:hypothetical protein
LISTERSINRLGAMVERPRVGDPSRSGRLYEGLRRFDERRPADSVGDGGRFLRMGPSERYECVVFEGFRKKEPNRFWCSSVGTT